jgi:hypothetical protein
MCTHHILLALLLCLAARQVNAQFAMSAGVEYFSEAEDASPIQMRERGPSLALGLAFTQPKRRGFLFACRGKFYAGEADYNGPFRARRS